MTIQKLIIQPSGILHHLPYVTKFKPITLAIASLPLLYGVAVANVSADDDIKSRIENLESEIKALKQSLQNTSNQSKPQSTGTQYQFGGFIKLDAFWTEMSDGERPASVGSDFLVPSLIVVDGEGGDAYFDAHAKHSRIWFKTTTDTDVGRLKSFIEVDFNSVSGDERLVNQNSSGIRHAFLSWDYSDSGQILAGQTWSTFFNVGALPESIDFIGPTSGTLFIRQAQLRWTKKLAAGGTFMLAAENPSTGLFDGGGGIDDNNIDDNSIPDLIARYDGKAASFSYSAAVMAREITYDTLSESDSATGLAVTVSGVYKLNNGDDIKLAFNYGTLGRYIALNAFRDGVVEADGSIDLIDVAGGYIAYKHAWSEKLRSTISYAISTADNPDSALGDLNKAVANGSVNLLYSPTKKLTFGTEFIYGTRELENGADGDIRRLQFTGKLVF